MIEKVKYTISDRFGGVPDGRKYEIEDTKKSEIEWKTSLATFAKEFSEFTGKKDYEFADWHYGMRSIFACLYTEKFYKPDFISKVQGILRKRENESFAQFECFNNNSDLIGCIMVFKGDVIFDRLSNENGLIAKLVRIEPHQRD
jgi:hypothetical protein